MIFYFFSSGVLVSLKYQFNNKGKKISLNSYVFSFYIDVCSQVGFYNYSMLYEFYLLFHSLLSQIYVLGFTAKVYIKYKHKAIM